MRNMPSRKCGQAPTLVRTPCRKEACMSAVVGIDLSTKALDLLKLDETTSRAEWVRCELAGKDAWERTLNVRDCLRGYLQFGETVANAEWWDDVYLVAIEAPYGRGQTGTNALLNRVVGAVAASLPAHLRAPERCWIVRPDEWKHGLGLSAKPTKDDVAALADGTTLSLTNIAVAALHNWEFDQNARDAYCIAMFARDTLAKATAA